MARRSSAFGDGRLLPLGIALGALLLAAFACMVPTDLLMSVVVLDPALSVGGLTFMIGGILSIVADRFRFLEGYKARDLWLPLLVYGSTAVILVALWPGIVRVGHGALAPAYTAFFCTLAWVCWEAVRRGGYPRPSALLAAAAATCWFATEIVGEIYNLGLGPVSEVALRIVWLFYAPNVALWALSAFDWGRMRRAEARR